MRRLKTILLFIFGLAVTVGGITLVLQQWESLVLVFRAAIGPLLAVTGLVIMFAAGLKA